jgi:8-oxo-dGTP pyrophosphatase MutT (NUDIX family)
VILPTNDPSLTSKGFPIDSLPKNIGGLLPIAASWDELTSVKRAAAVLLLMIPPLQNTADSRIVLIRRSAQVRSHRGQIGFPGGRREPSDKGPCETALRETQEELGVAPDRIRVLGMLPKAKSLDGMPVVPIVGIATVTSDSLTPEPSEVEDFYAIEWPHFSPEKYHVFNMNIFGIWRQSGVFLTQGLSVWGLTAHVLCTASLG